MPRPKRNRQVKRLSLEVSLLTHETLLRLVEETDANSMTEVIQRAIKVYDEIKGSNKLFIKDEFGNEREIVFL